MKTNIMKLPQLAAGLGLATIVALSGCAQDQTEVDTIATELELEDGGFEMSDELPMFGDSTLDVDFPEEVPVADPIEQDVEVVAMMNDVDAVLFNVALEWGQLPGDPSNTTPRNWSGQFRVNRGAIIVRRTNRFEPATDWVLPRSDRQTVEVRTITGPHHDGIRLTVIDPRPEDGPLVLSYVTVAGGVHSMPMAALVNGPVTAVVDDANNRIVGVANARPLDFCSHGSLHGKWKKFADHRGRFRGVVRNADGDPQGHIRGVYGRRANGDKVFFGKYIRRDGTFQGIFRGRYDNGHFAGRWHNRGGEIGALGGAYTEDLIPGPAAGGHFLGRWRELTCNVPVGPGVPVPGEDSPDPSGA